jgi:SAM-dependent methyltransferase
LVTGVRRFVANALQLADAVVLVHPTTAAPERERLVSLEREGLPVVVFDVPGQALEAGHLARLCANAMRHFRANAAVAVRLSVDDQAVAVHPGALRAGIAALVRSCAEGSSPGGRAPDEPGATGAPPPNVQVFIYNPTEGTAEARPVGVDASLGPARPLRASRIGGRVLGRLRDRLVAHPEGRRGASEALAERVSGGLPGPCDATADVLRSRYNASNVYVDLPPFRFMWDKYRPRSVLDLGCGPGAYVRAFSLWGSETALGVDRLPPSEVLMGRGVYSEHDLRTSVDLGRRFELVVCTEVLEHIDAEYEETAFQAVRRHARGLILFSAARAGQPGDGHVNTRPIEHWIERWADAGWAPDTFDSLAVRALANFHWFRRNLLVLRPVREVTRRRSAFTLDDLESFEAVNLPWENQPRMICTFPLQIGLPTRSS